MNADWYPDPTNRTRQRFWDGVNWTRHVYGPQGQGTDDFVPAGPPPGVATELWASAPSEATGGTPGAGQPADSAGPYAPSASDAGEAGYGAPPAGAGYGDQPGAGYGGQPGAGPAPGYGGPGGPGYGAPGGSGYGAPGGSGYGAPGVPGYGQPGGAGYGAPGATGYGQPGGAGYGQPGPSAPYGYSSPYASPPAYGSPSPYGSPYVSPYAAPGFTPVQGNGLATASLVLGLCGAIIEWGGLLTLTAGLLAIIFGVIGMKRARAMAGQYGAGRGRAIAGLILGCLAVVAYVFWGLLTWALFII